MRRVHLWGLLVVALSAFAALAAAQASAEEVPQWLVSGATIAKEGSVTADVSIPMGKLLLIQDMNAATQPDVLCELKMVWSLLSNGGTEMESGSCINPVTDGGTCTSPKVSPIDLRWQATILEPTGGGFELDITNGTGGNPGFLVECTILGMKIDDNCTTTRFKPGLFSNVLAGIVEAIFFETVNQVEQANCTIGGAEEGLIVAELNIEALNANQMPVQLEVALAPEVP